MSDKLYFGRKCVIRECLNTAFARFVCRPHYQQLRNVGAFDMRTTKKTIVRDHPLYQRWSGMKHRCGRTTGDKYKNYGGRGIRVCDRWKSDFWAFVADVGLPPSPYHTLDRIDNDGNYEPGNVRWATATEQANNRRRPRRPSRLSTHPMTAAAD